MFWPHCTACGILVPWPWIKPTTPGMKAWILSHWTTMEAPMAFRLLILPVRFSRKGIFFCLTSLFFKSSSTHPTHFLLLSSPYPISVSLRAPTCSWGRGNFIRIPRGHLSPWSPGPDHLLNPRYNIWSQEAEAPLWAWCVTLYLLSGNSM